MITPSTTSHKQAVQSSDAEIRPDLLKVKAVIDSLQLPFQHTKIVHNLSSIYLL